MPVVEASLTLSFFTITNMLVAASQILWSGVVCHSISVFTFDLVHGRNDSHACMHFQTSSPFLMQNHFGKPIFAD